ITCSARRFFGRKFKRQKSVGNYLVDFVCFSPTPIVEVDGGSLPKKGNTIIESQKLYFPT
ncbi:MAG TPA: DUF559 domain-containing protein, partial [Nitrosospira sp.]